MITSKSSEVRRIRRVYREEVRRAMRAGRRARIAEKHAFLANA